MEGEKVDQAKTGRLREEEGEWSRGDEGRERYFTCGYCLILK